MFHHQSSADIEALLENLTTLISRYPKYASARNNRVQSIRTIYGDGLLVSNTQKSLDPEQDRSDEKRKRDAAEVALSDLATAIDLLSAASLSKLST